MQKGKELASEEALKLLGSNDKLLDLPLRCWSFEELIRRPKPSYLESPKRPWDYMPETTTFVPKWRG